MYFIFLTFHSTSKISLYHLLLKSLDAKNHYRVPQLVRSLCVLKAHQVLSKICNRRQLYYQQGYHMLRRFRVIQGAKLGHSISVQKFVLNVVQPFISLYWSRDHTGASLLIYLRQLISSPQDSTKGSQLLVKNFKTTGHLNPFQDQINAHQNPKLMLLYSRKTKTADLHRNRLLHQGHSEFQLHFCRFINF